MKPWELWWMGQFLLVIRLPLLDVCCFCSRWFFLCPCTGWPTTRNVLPFWGGAAVTAPPAWFGASASFHLSSPVCFKSLFFCKVFPDSWKWNEPTYFMKPENYPSGIERKQTKQETTTNPNRICTRKTYIFCIVLIEMKTPRGKKLHLWNVWWISFTYGHLVSIINEW